MEPTRKEKTHRNDQIEQPALLIPVQEAFAFPLIRSAAGLDLLGEGIDVHLDALQTLRDAHPNAGVGQPLDDGPRRPLVAGRVLDPDGQLPYLRIGQERHGGCCWWSSLR